MRDISPCQELIEFKTLEEEQDFYVFLKKMFFNNIITDNFYKHGHRSII